MPGTLPPNDLLTEYIEVAMAEAVYEILEDDGPTMARFLASRAFTPMRRTLMTAVCCLGKSWKVGSFSVSNWDIQSRCSSQ